MPVITLSIRKASLLSTSHRAQENAVQYFSLDGLLRNALHLAQATSSGPVDGELLPIAERDSGTVSGAG